MREHCPCPRGLQPARDRPRASPDAVSEDLGAALGLQCPHLARQVLLRRAQCRILRLICAPAKPLPPLSASLVAKFLNFATMATMAQRSSSVTEVRQPSANRATGRRKRLPSGASDLELGALSRFTSLGLDSHNRRGGMPVLNVRRAPVAQPRSGCGGWRRRRSSAAVGFAYTRP